MKIYYKIYKEERLLVRRLVGRFDIVEMRTHFEDIIKDKDWIFVKNILNDIWELADAFSYEELMELTILKRQYVKDIHYGVFLVTSPLLTAFSHLLQNEMCMHNYKYEYCSTVNKASQYLRLSSGFSLEDSLATMKTNCNIPNMVKP